LPQPEKITGTITHVHYKSPNWSAGRLKSDEGDNISFSGNLCAEQDKYVTLIGAFKTHPKYGQQFNVKSIEISIPTSAEGLATFLEKHPAMRGIGKVRSKKLAKVFGNDFEEVLLNSPEQIAQIAGIPSRDVLQMSEEWKRTTTTNAAMIQLAAYGLSYHQMATLTAKYGNNIIAILKEDPYFMLGELDGFGFKRIDEIALKSGVKKALPNRIRACLMWIVRDVLSNEGSTWIDQVEFLEKANEYLLIDDLQSHAMIRKAMFSILDNKNLRAEFIKKREKVVCAITLPNIYQMEKELARIFEKYACYNLMTERENGDKLIDFDINILNKKQQQAFINALYRISLISGGAGTGKSYTVAAITEFFSKSNYNVTLCAPTGKAARRLEEVCDNKFKASTIHKLLGYDGRKFKHDFLNKLETDIIIVDEVSMVDVPLMSALFDAINFETTSVVLVGDHNQLPPVGPGNILRDLIQTQAIPTTILTECIRQQGELKKNCSAILDGELRKTTPKLPNGAREWYLINNLSSPGMVSALLKEMFEEYLPKLGFDLLKEVQVLTPTHKGPIGTKELNRMLQKIMQAKIYRRNIIQDKRLRPVKGDKVICTKNNYDLDIMNGEMGIIFRELSGGEAAINFGNDKKRTLTKEQMGHIQLAYALTIHKVQGSEFPCAVLVMHKSHSFMHHRGLLYTGVTRASKSTIILGDNWGIRNCASKIKTDHRNTFLRELLKND